MMDEEINPGEEVDDDIDLGEDQDLEESQDEGEGVDEAGEAGDEGQGEEPVSGRQPGRGTARVQEALKKAEEAERRAEAAERKAREVEQRYSTVDIEKRNREFQEERARRLSMMDPDQKTEFLLNEQAQLTERRFKDLEIRQTDNMDKAAFDAKASVDPVFAKYKDEVEKIISGAKRDGHGFVPRELALKIAIGEAVLNKGGAAKTRQTTRAAARVQGAQARPVTARGDSAPGAGRGKTAEDRLRGVMI